MTTVEKIKDNVEIILKKSLTQNEFEEAFKLAKKKQNYIYIRDNNKTVLQNWYLVALTAEYVRSLAFQRFTMDLCERHENMEKEHFTHKCKSALPVPHIVSSSV